MALKFGKTTVTLTVPFADDVVVLEYNPWRFSKAFWADLRKSLKLDEKARKAFEKRQADAVAAGDDFDEEYVSPVEGFDHQVIADTVKRWDIENDDGSMYPLTLAAIGDLPTALTGVIATAIIEHVNGDSDPKAKRTQPQSDGSVLAA